MRPRRWVVVARRRRKGLERRIARERIEVLFRLAEKAVLRGQRARADRYAQLARRIAMRYNLSLPTSHRRRVCRSCGAYLDPGGGARVRVRPTRVVVTCRACGRVYRYPFRRERAAPRTGGQ